MRGGERTSINSVGVLPYCPAGVGQFTHVCLLWSIHSCCDSRNMWDPGKCYDKLLPRVWNWDVLRIVFIFFFFRAKETIFQLQLYYAGDVTVSCWGKAALFGNVELKFWHRLYLNRRDWEMRLGKYQHHNRCDWVKKAPFVLRVKFKFERMIILHHPCEYLRIYFSWRYDSIFIIVTH